tara:strand:+ start:2905 stop:3015 length:111 start_codon:yes stop_codon:yes gene_type:complete
VQRHANTNPTVPVLNPRLGKKGQSIQNDLAVVLAEL